LRVAAIGVTGDALERATALVNAGVDAIIIDTAHGHQGVVNTLKEVKINFPIDVIVGNATPALFLVENGADGVKVGMDLVQFVLHVSGVGFPQCSS
jgi:IMP dehydrogenase